jgi:hypothetical protein
MLRTLERRSKRFAALVLSSSDGGDDSNEDESADSEARSGCSSLLALLTL